LKITNDGDFCSAQVCEGTYAIIERKNKNGSIRKRYVKLNIKGENADLFISDEEMIVIDYEEV